jgi:putative tricarboxylic transport membrane protein
MEVFGHLATGFGVALSAINLLYALIGVLLGTLIGVLPGIGPVATIAMLLPTTYALEPVSALIMLAGIYYGAQYGGSTTAILVNMPGESSSVVTCLDGYQMARNGQAGAALSIAALGSFFAGTCATLLVAAVSLPLSALALKFGPAEYFSLMVLGLIGAVVLAHGSLVKAIAMIVLGLLLGIVGTDVNSGVERFTFGIPELSDGIGVVVVAMGLFGFAEIILNLQSTEKREIIRTKLTGIWLSKRQLREAAPAVLRGTALGSMLGVLPGGGAMLSSFASYSIEKKIARDPSRFGKGAIQGVAGPEAANNAGAQTSFIPLLTLGIPENAVMAMMVGAMTIHNIQPGPQVMTSNPQLFWGLIASMWVGNLMLVVLNLPLIGIWIKLLSVPYRMLYPAILLFCSIGVYTVNNTSFDVMQTAFFGALGVLFAKLECEPAAIMLVLVIAVPNIRRQREQAFQEA